MSDFIEINPNDLEQLINTTIEYKMRFLLTYEGKIEENVDPEGKGRVQVSIHELELESPSKWLWANPEFPNRGSFIIPAIGDEVKIYFQGGNPEEPVYRGYFYYLNENPLPETDPNKGILVHTSGADIKIDWDDLTGELNISTTGDINIVGGLAGTINLQTDIPGIGAITIDPSGVILGQGLGGNIACVGTNFVTTLLGPQSILPGVNTTNKA